MKRSLSITADAKKLKPVLPDDLFPIVGIGASAGGLEALSRFFEHIPEGYDTAFIIVQHLDPTQKGMMPELLQRITTLTVVQVTDRLKVKPGHVYVIPPNRNMSILNRTLYLFERNITKGLYFPIDFFFHSLADDLRDKSIGIILSGMGTDGSMGLRRIKENSGTALVQSPSSAKFDGMPNSALESVSADIVAPPEEMPEKLINYIRSNSVIKNDPSVKFKDGSTVEKIILLLRTHTGNDFSLYKKTTLFRRIERRMEIHKLSSIDSYLRYLRDTPAELDILFRELLIGVTGFFRNPDVWEKFRESILEPMLKALPEGYGVRAWIPACATGEEAYSLGIIFMEAVELLNLQRNLSLQIYATDINVDSIEMARRGFFNPNIVSEVSAERLKRFFTKTETGYRIINRIREMIVFAPHNLIKDPPFTKIDILICRNLLIYFEPLLQKKVISVFHYSLNPEGLLILGNEESVGSETKLFKKINTKLRIYKRSDTNTERDNVDFQAMLPENKFQATVTKIKLKAPENIQSQTIDLLLSRFTPASVLVNNKGDILYITGHTGKYLEPAAGKANMNIFAMVREELQLEFPIAFRKALGSYEKVILHNINIDSDGKNQLAEIIIQQIEKPAVLKGLLIVVFKDVAPVHALKQTKTRSRKINETSRLTELEMELDHMKEELRTTLDAMQSSEEDLKSVNEELQSTNEELQSTNEELTTSKEEMQSMNEELQTVNIELMSKIEDFSKINNDLKNLLTSTEIATLFLDKNLKVRRFTKQVADIFRLLPGDIGRPFTDLSTDLVYKGMQEDAVEVLQTLAFNEKEITTNSGKWYKIRIMPYRTTDDLIDGLVITFSDISLSKKLEDELNKTIARLRSGKKTSK